MKKKTIVIGVAGGIAAYKALDVVSRLKKKDYDVHVIMTKSACEFVTPLSFQALSQNDVVYDMFEEPKAWEIQHISLAKKADLLLVVPATANIIGKIANGIADDMLSTTIMATKGKVVFAPAMNVNMYDNPIVQNNISKLKNYGYGFIEPASGRLACGDVGKGKLADTELIAEKVHSLMYSNKDLIGKKILITAGPTISKIDPVRYITNHSSGKMGYEIAMEARDRGAEVTLVSGPTSLETPFGINVIKVETNEEMFEAVMNNQMESDIIIKSAAVADYKPKKYSTQKIKKSDDNLNIEFEKDTDILKELGRRKEHQILVGFAAESENLIENALKKIEKKNLDYIIVNDISRKDIGFKSNENEAVLITKSKECIEFGKCSKREMAFKIFECILHE
ncbi:bifunctional phosphopantothenoylcysteine decarboxylase/phosphopantothenate--cysteine ligase CoaBC [Oceanirhabdus sp. W0125-5]|uniref:bifunctional phosphopantothenoylcysteine decarboxylase/phosphopantothenate--cysteine ligase CoaBC n=1 Tax=Oceanirhabdus sp. W0125-5 TaxID=2999116 RepID=UPI0022F32EA7|nr:bifunctional phosphopantothenoylcysteine decarboxylase/phosphopantothenate--cysteine ligase CoaBC [Oceanirhabdus sp. W0125-5]WBW94778.1 bifunctional phosphopantothenoylcysteine decarboxylase/phosphopantothenate--cysteine ligase CoaBC [Oceanirhabdus sp. W0125-5]